MINSKNTYILKNKKTNTNYGTVINDKSYVIGFKSNQMANKMSKIIDTEKLVILFQQKELVYMSKLYIPVTKPNNNMFKSMKISVNDFMEYPNTKNIGIIYTMDLDYNGELFTEFSSLIIEPLNDIEAYRTNLCNVF